MKLLIVSQYYWPESFLINSLSKKLLNMGHDITVITGKPNYPKGKIYNGYRCLGIENDNYNGIEVIRIPLLPRGDSFIGLILNYISFVVSGILFSYRQVKNREFDIIFVYAPSPITSAIPAVWLNKKIKSHLVIWVQDLWPESLSATGYISNKHVLRLVSLVVRWIYLHSDTLLAQSHSFVRKIKEYTAKENIIYYPNSIEGQEKTKLFPELPVNIRSLLQDEFNIVFTGNIGKAQSIPTILQAALALSDTDCRFVFVGDGSMVEWAKQSVKELGLSNVMFIGRLDSKYMPSIYKLSDALLLSLTADEIFSYTIPSKLQSYLSSGRPIIASVNGEAGDIIRAAGAGVVCPSEDASLLASEIRIFRELPEEKRNAMGAAGFEYFTKNYEMNKMAERLVDILKERAGVKQ